MTMAQPSSAQREPSMEEILASIRRIIEDSDGNRKPETGAPQGEAEPAARAEVETFRAELTEPPREASRPVPSGPEPSLSAVREQRRAAEFAPRPFRLAEVQAQAAREASGPRQAGEQKPATPSEVQQFFREPAAAPPVQMTPPPVSPAAAPASAPVAPSARDAVRPSIEDEVEKALEETLAEAAAPPVARSSEERETGTDVAIPGGEPVPRPIISPSAGRQIAASFGELSEALAARSKKTLDEMAEEMLRPMLQEWLDDNLPVLVERLVREEIERVARGG